jgi:hypothetical protein
MSRPAELPLRLEAEGVFVDRACANRVFALGSGGAHGTLRPVPALRSRRGIVCFGRCARVATRKSGSTLSIVTKAEV